MKDGLGRTIEYLRISVTDKCNLRCQYCMPEGGVRQLAHEECLSLEEIYRLTAILAEQGIRKVRFTGGEPLVRKNLVKLVEDVANLEQVEEVAMTTNGVLLADNLAALKTAGLTSVNISLDTLSGTEFEQITGRDELGKVRAAIEQALAMNLKVKINCVPIKEMNETGSLEVAKLARNYPVDVRYIEWMPMGCGRQFTAITGEEMRKHLEEIYGLSTKTEDRENGGPARYVAFEGFKGRIGFIEPMSHKFCGECNRIRLTVDGKLKLCLYHSDSCDLRALLRGEATDLQIQNAIEEALQRKPKEHFFGENKPRDARKMVQIGG